LHAHAGLPESNVATLIGAIVPQSIAAAMPLVLPDLLPVPLPVVEPLVEPLVDPLAAVSPPPSPAGVAVSSPPHPVAIAPMIAPNPENPKSHCEGRMMFEASLEARTISVDPRARQ
jgi:hypothetical protein